MQTPNFKPKETCSPSSLLNIYGFVRLQEIILAPIDDLYPAKDMMLINGPTLFTAFRRCSGDALLDSLGFISWPPIKQFWTIEKYYI